MGRNMRDRTEVCPLPPGPLKDLNRHLRPRTIFMAVGLSFILTSAALTSFMMVSQIQGELLIGLAKDTYLGPSLEPGTPHAPIDIDGDANFTATALLEGWPGDGSPENPYLIDGLDIDHGGEYGNCIDIRNTRVDFIICNCNFIGAPADTHGTGRGAGIYLNNVTNGELVNNICNKSFFGILLDSSNSNTLTNNTCNINGFGIHLNDSESNTLTKNSCSSNVITGISLRYSDGNTVVNNLCNSNGGEDYWLESGIYLGWSSCNNVANNTCKYNVRGVHLSYSWSNTVMHNTCNNNSIGIDLFYADSNTVTDNICSNNRVGIYLQGTGSNTLENNIFSGNTEHDIVHESELEELAHREYMAEQFVWFLAGCGMILVVSVVAFVKFRRMGI